MTYPDGAPGSAGTADDDTSLSFLECGLCAELSFPAEVYGCRNCGASPDHGTTLTRPGRGQLRQFVTVHAQLTTSPKAPYVVGWVEIAPSLIVEALLRVESESELAPGMRMRAVPDPTPQATVSEAMPARADDGLRPLWFTSEAALEDAR